MNEWNFFLIVEKDFPKSAEFYLYKLFIKYYLRTRKRASVDIIFNLVQLLVLYVKDRVILTIKLNLLLFLQLHLRHYHILRYTSVCKNPILTLLLNIVDKIILKMKVNESLIFNSEWELSVFFYCIKFLAEGSVD